MVSPIEVKSNSVYRFHLRWAKKGLFKKLLHRSAKQFNRSRFKIIDASYIKVHQDACYQCKNIENQCFGKTKGGKNSKLHALTNHQGMPSDFILLPGNQHEVTNAIELLGNTKHHIVFADKGYDSDVLRSPIHKQEGVANIPPRSNRIEDVFYSKEAGKKRYVVENYFQKIKRFRRVNTRYDRLPQTYEAFVALISAYLCIK